MGKLGWIAAFVYVAGAALRLARFNTMLEVADKHWFTGMPSPAAAALVAGLVWIIDDYGIDPSTLRWWVWCVTVFAGLTMVSNVRYYSFKTINLKKSVPFLAIFVFVLVIALLSYQPAIVLVRRVRRLRDVGLRRFGVEVDGVAPPAQRRAADVARATPRRIAARTANPLRAPAILRL